MECLFIVVGCLERILSIVSEHCEIHKVFRSCAKSSATSVWPWLSGTTKTTKTLLKTDKNNFNW